MKKTKFNNSTWKRVLSSKAVVIPTVIIGLVLLYGIVVYIMVNGAKGMMRTANQPDPNNTPAPPTAEPTASPEPSKIIGSGLELSFDPDISEMELLQGHGEDEEIEFTREYWTDVTPEGLANLQPGTQIIRHVPTGITYLLHPSGTYALDEGRNNTGVIDFALFDMNGDESQELLYTVSAGYDADYTCSVGMFDFETMTRHFTDCAVKETDLAIVVTEFGVEIYRAKRTSVDDEENLGGYALTLTEKFGDLVERNGLPVLYVD